jgi:hypothetical protein
MQRSPLDPSRRSFRFLAVIFLATIYIPLLPGQKQGSSGAPKYDAQTETRMKATVEEVKLPPKGSEKEIVHLLVNVGAEKQDVYLCPKAFLDDMGVSFAKGDEIEITGSKVKQDGADLLLAREVAKGTDTLVLRDDKGKPVW